MLTTFKKNKLLKITSFLMLAALLQGCVVATVAVVATGASMATDRRSFGNQIDDQNIEFKAYTRISEDEALNGHTNLHLVSVNGSVLVVGQAPNNHLRDLVIKTIESVDGVIQIHNQVRIGTITSLTTQTNDVWLTSKVKSALFSSDKINGKNIKVITENAEVFLMGIVSRAEADNAVEITRNITGVNRVFKAFEFLE